MTSLESQPPITAITSTIGLCFILPGSDYKYSQETLELWIGTWNNNGTGYFCDGFLIPLGSS